MEIGNSASFNCFNISIENNSAKYHILAAILNLSAISSYYLEHNILQITFEPICQNISTSYAGYIDLSRR